MDTMTGRGSLTARIEQARRCEGCAQQDALHRHNDAEDGPRATCCAHTCPASERLQARYPAKDMTAY